MGCGCGGGKKAATGQWVYVAPDGERTVKASEVEAKAVKIRAGGVGTVQKVAS